MAKEKYVPALSFKWLTPLYDLIVSYTLPEKIIKEELLDISAIVAGNKVLDFGCGTGTLTIMAKEACRDTEITGIDIDIDILNIAIKRIKEKQLDIFLIDYGGDKFPFKSNHFSNVISCLVFHHLDSATKRKVLAEIYRILSQYGVLTIADFGRSDSRIQRMLFNIIRILDGFKPTKANAEGKLPDLIQEAGFSTVLIKKKFKTIFGEVQLLKATKN